MSNWTYLRNEYLPPFLKKHGDDGKRVVFLWLMTKVNVSSIEYFNTGNQTLLIYKDELNKYTNLDEITDSIKKYIFTIEYPSELAKWLSNIDFLNPTCLAEHNITRLSKQDGSEPPLILLSFMNFHAPRLTGYIMENLLYLLIKKGDIVLSGKYEELLNSFEIENMRDIPICRDEIKYICNKFIYRNDENYMFIDFVNYVIFKSIHQFLKKGIDLDKLEELWQFLKIFNEAEKKQFKKYIDELKQTTFVKKLQKIYNENCHSVDVAGRYLDYPNNLHGEIDFMFNKPYTIIDSKVVKNPDTLAWYYQLDIYSKLLGKKIIPLLQIVNFLENKIYTFK